MSHFYYLIEQISKDSFGKKLTWKKAKTIAKKHKIALSIVIIIELFLLSLPFTITKFEINSLFVLLLVFTCLIILYYISNTIDFTFVIHNQEIKKFKTTLEKHGFKEKEQIDMLQKEINSYLSNQNNYFRQLLTMLSKCLFFFLWTPSSFLIGFYFTQFSTTLTLHQLIDIVVNLFILSGTIIGLLILISPIVNEIFNLNNSKMKQINVYLENVKYYYNGCSLIPFKDN